MSRDVDERPPAREGGGRRLAVVAGSGMSGVADAFDVRTTVPFDAIAGVGRCTVDGHAGEVRWCRHGSAWFAVVLGRRHVYEGEPGAMLRLFEWLLGCGVTDLVVTSAAGSLSRDLPVGEMVIVHDVLDLQHRRRIATTSECVPGGPGNAQLRFDGRGRPAPRVDAPLTFAVEQACRRAGVAASRGVLACHAGPAYETPAEVLFSRRTGATLVTMSAAPEIAHAAHLGMRVAAVATITNPATGIGLRAPGHGDVIEVAGRTSPNLARVILQLVEKYSVGDNGVAPPPFGG